jgi:hypothetical protein
LVIADKLIKISQLLGKQSIDCNLLGYAESDFLSTFNVSTHLFYFMTNASLFTSAAQGLVEKIP